MDLEVLTTTGFCSAVGASVEKMQGSWFAKKQKEQRQIASFDTAGPVIASRARQPIAVPSSG
jgi:hypothetical protein